jgi:hypothetical protein
MVPHLGIGFSIQVEQSPTEHVGHASPDQIA